VLPVKKLEFVEDWQLLACTDCTITGNLHLFSRRKTTADYQNSTPNFLDDPY
jgi:hypothetical protein